MSADARQERPRGPVAWAVSLMRGFRGHPSHPPFTDLTIGAFSVGSILAVLGAFGFRERLTGAGAYLAVVVGLVAATVTILTGFLDYVRIPRGTSARRTAMIHWTTMVTATAVYVAAAALLQRAYSAGNVTPAAAIVSAVAWAILLWGSWVGGAMVFVYGVRVLGHGDESTSDALKPKLPPD